MLDKTLPYYHVIMLRQAGSSVPKFALPAGFRFSLFTPGKEEKWAEIVTSVGEFERTADALKYFASEYLPFSPELERRLLFIVTEKGEEVAAITGWWNYTGRRRDPSIHWVAVKPEYQGFGLGKALVAEGLQRLLHLEGDLDIYLHTQTWSYKAIGIYLQAGFRIMRQGSFGTYKNECAQALPVLIEKLCGGTENKESAITKWLI
ncbi:GNAT family N-acetyltransferase [Paenibacillus hamazuiensis]|uniref:GNAT family N-acetyltransferase n=1 Tax=Paenibacillus hamazuiensis TaxID=2936508 RepID=UPI00200C1996|nr:GNAT family N-acetyltransferase [Paenibacillus hamazuiensis]